MKAMPPRCLSILCISDPVLACNNRGESEGTLQTLQKINTPDGTRSTLSGVSLRYAVRKAIQDRGLPTWRQVVPPTEQNPVGLVYGDNQSPTMSGAIPATAKGYADEVFGWMIATTGSEDDATKKGADIAISAALSGTPYIGDLAFRQGHRTDLTDKGTTALAPFQQEQHWTRYQFLVTLDITKVTGEVLRAILESLKGLQVGGGHTANLTELTPCVLAWRFHHQGQSGLYLAGGIDIPPDEPVDLSPLRARAENLGITFQTAGLGQDCTIAAAIETMLTEAAQMREAVLAADEARRAEQAASLATRPAPAAKPPKAKKGKAAETKAEEPASTEEA